MATKLHELLAVKDNVTLQAAKLIKDLTGTFKGKKHLFEEKRKVFKSNEEGVPDKVEEQSDIQTSVTQEIHWLKGHLAKSLDVSYQVDLCNMDARADVVLEDGTILLKAVPATMLLHLERHRIPEWRDLVLSIATLDPAKGFRPDSDRGPGYFRARDVEKVREKKDREVIRLAPATKEHAEQAVLVDVQKPVGTILEQEWSALLTPAKKSEVMEQIEDLFRAVAKARAKANEHSIDTADKKIGATLLDFAFKPLQGA